MLDEIHAIIADLRKESPLCDALVGIPIAVKDSNVDFIAGGDGIIFNPSFKDRTREEKEEALLMLATFFTFRPSNREDMKKIYPDAVEIDPNEF